MSFEFFLSLYDAHSRSQGPQLFRVVTPLLLREDPIGLAPVPNLARAFWLVRTSLSLLPRPSSIFLIIAADSSKVTHLFVLSVEHMSLSFLQSSSKKLVLGCNILSPGCPWLFTYLALAFFRSSVLCGVKRGRWHNREGHTVLSVISGEGEAVTEYLGRPIPSGAKPPTCEYAAAAANALSAHCHWRNEREDRPRWGRQNQRAVPFSVEHGE